MILRGEKKKRRKKTDRQTKQPRIDHNELSPRMKKKVVGSDQSIS